jgi:hypothetical protein
VNGSAPGLFTSDFSGKGQAAALNESGRLNSSKDPAAPGSVVTLYGTGFGELAPSQERDALGRTVWKPILPVSVYLGTMEVKVRVPEAAPHGPVPVRVGVGRADSQAGVTVAVGSRELE